MDGGAVHTGRCNCGAVTFSARIPELHMDACHCGMCRRQAAGPMMMLTVKDLEVGGGDSLGIYEASAWGQRLFCRSCGSAIAWRMKDGSHASVSAFAFDEPVGADLAVEIFIDEKPDGYAFAGSAQKMTGAQVVAMFAGGNPDG